MSGQSDHQKTKEGEVRLGLSRFVFQTGMGALTASLVWCFLANGEWESEHKNLIPLILFGLAIPWAVVAIPAQIVSSATASGRFLMAVSAVLAVLALVLSLGKIFFSWDRVLIVVLAGVIAAMGVIAQMLWARLWNLRAGPGSRVVRREGILSYGGWMFGVVAALFAGFLGGPHYGLSFGAAAVVTSGWIIQFAPRKSSSANWLSNRSALRLFAAIENALRNRYSRLILFRVLWFSGAFLSLVSMIPGGWDPSIGAPSGSGGMSFYSAYAALAVVLLAALAGTASGSSMLFISMAERRPGPVLSVICLFAPAAAVGIAMFPAGLKAVPAFVLGACWGAVMGAASRDLRQSLGRGFAAEAEVLLLSIAGVGGVVFLGCIWPAHLVFGFGPFLLIAELLLFAGFAFVWRRRWISRSENSSERFFDPWYPGKIDFRPEQGDAARLISVTYEIPEGRRESFAAAIRELAHLRQKQGALYWSLTKPEENPDCLTEQFIVESLLDYQDAIRSETETDREIKQRVFDLNHWDSLPYETQSPLLDV